MQKVYEIEFESFGTHLSIKIFDQLPNIIQEKIKLEVLDYTNYFDESFSRFKENSIITNISKKSGKFSVPKELTEMLLIYKKFNSASEGKMNPLIGNTISDLGYDAKYSLVKKGNIRPTPNFEDSLKIISDTEIETHENVLIDVGALGKGYWVDQIKKIFQKYNLKKFIIDGSGDIYFCNSEDDQSLNIELEADGKIIGETKIINGAICGSGIGKRNWSFKESDNLHHVLDATTNLPTEDVESVWVKHKNTTYADALATALFFTKPDILKEKLNKELNMDFEYLILYKNKKILVSENFNMN